MKVLSALEATSRLLLLRTSTICLLQLPKSAQPDQIQRLIIRATRPRLAQQQIPGRRPLHFPLLRMRQSAAAWSKTLLALPSLVLATMTFRNNSNTSAILRRAAIARVSTRTVTPASMGRIQCAIPLSDFLSLSISTISIKQQRTLKTPALVIFLGRLRK